MSENKVVVTPETEESVPVKKDFWASYSKPIIIAGSAVILIVGGWFGYKKLVKEPNELKGNEAIFAAEAIFDKMATTGFSKDSVDIVINGRVVDGNKITGLLTVIKTYGGTEAGNRANYMVGASYLHIKDFEKAIKYLKEFEGHGATQVESKADLMIGHAYAEQKKTDDALSYYKKAANVNDKDASVSADALLIAASYAEATGKSKDAIELFQQLKTKYPLSTSVANGDVDKYLAKLGIVD
jgi:TolA-binding protein